MLNLLENNGSIYKQLLARKDYSSVKAKQETILKIYQWLQSLPNKPAMKNRIDINQWKLELKSQFGYLLSESEASAQELQKVLKKLPPFNFHQILTGADETSRKQKFQRLIAVLLKEQWIVPSKLKECTCSEIPEPADDSNWQLFILHLINLATLKKKLTAPKVAALFNIWLSHSISRESFIKAFQTEQQDTFNCAPNKLRYKYVQECRLLIGDL